MQKVSRFLLFAGIAGAGEYSLQYQLKAFKYQQVAQTMGLLFVLSAIFILPIDKVLSRSFIGMWMFSWLIEGNFKNRWNEIKLIPLQWLALILPMVYFTYNALSIFYSTNIPDGLLRIETRLSFFIFPLAFALSSRTYFYNKLMFLKVFLFGSIIGSLLCLSYAFHNSIFMHEGVLTFQHAVYSGLSGESFFTLIGNRVSYFSYMYLAKSHHPSYFSMYLVFSIAIAYYLYKSAQLKNYKVLYLLSIGFLYIMVYLLSSRAGLISLMGVLIVLTIVEIKNTHRYVLVLCISVALNFALYKAMTVTQMKANVIEMKSLSKDNIKEKTIQAVKPHSDVSLSEVSNKKVAIQAVKPLKEVRPSEQQVITPKVKVYKDARLNIWQASTASISKNIWFGSGIGDKQDALLEAYAANNYKIGLKKNLNAHNQFLGAMISGGILQLILLLSILLIAMIYAFIHKQLLLGILIGLFSVNMMVESMLETMGGVVFFAFFYSILIRFRFKSIKQLQS